MTAMCLVNYNDEYPTQLIEALLDQGGVVVANNCSFTEVETLARDGLYNIQCDIDYKNRENEFILNNIPLDNIHSFILLDKFKNNVKIAPDFLEKMVKYFEFSDIAVSYCDFKINGLNIVCGRELKTIKSLPILSIKNFPDFVKICDLPLRNIIDVARSRSVLGYVTESLIEIDEQ